MKTASSDSGRLGDRRRGGSRRIVNNLLFNACEAVRDSKCVTRRITVALVRGDDMIIVSVRDDGVRISDERMQRVLEPGFTTKIGGFGAGLAASVEGGPPTRRRVDAHSDGEGKGATFFLELPVASED